MLASKNDAQCHKVITACMRSQGTNTLQFLLGHTCIGFLGISTDLLLARPANSLESLGQDGVAKVVCRVHPIGIHGGQVLNLEFDER